jgi:hypothetical protein
MVGRNVVTGKKQATLEFRFYSEGISPMAAMKPFPGPVMARWK